MYNSHEKKKTLFTEESQVKFLKIRDKAQELLKVAGAFRMQEVMLGVTGSTWETMACVDRLVELNEIQELPRQCAGQHRIFTER